MLIRSMEQLPCIAVDYLYYNKLVVPLLNIVLYNSTTQHGGGAQLYGEEPWWFYLLNLALNFNVALPLAIVSVPVRRRRAMMALDELALVCSSE